jgi:hypothetical protein
VNARDKIPKASANELPEDVKAELLRRVENLPNEKLIPADEVFDQIRRHLRERSTPSPG